MATIYARPPYQKLASLTRKKNEIENLISQPSYYIDELRESYTEYMVRLDNLYEACEGNNDALYWLEKQQPSIEKFKSHIKNLLCGSDRRKSDSVERRRFGQVNDAAELCKSTGGEPDLVQCQNFIPPPPEFEKSVHVHPFITENLNTVEYAVSLPVKMNRGLAGREKLRAVSLEARSIPRSTKSTSSEASQRSTSSARVRLAERKARICADKEHLKKLKKVEERENQIKRERKDLELNRELTECKILERELNKIDSLDEESLESLADAVDRIKFMYGEKKSDDSHEEINHNYSCHNDGTSLRKCSPLSATIQESSPSIGTLAEALRVQNEISLSLRGQQDSSSLPRKELEPFDGTDITKFKGFWKKFEVIIESRCKHDIDKFTYLEQYTAGQARRIVQSCCSDDPSSAYRSAKLYLCREYDNEFKVAHAFLEILDEWPAIKTDDTEALRDLSVFLNKCKMHLENKSLYNQLNSPKEILSVVAKLPYRLRDKWRYRTLDVTKINDIVTFDDLACFVEVELEVMEQPLWGDLSNQLQRKKTANFKSGKMLKTLASSDTLEVEECSYCEEEGHHISSCRKFGEESFEKKSEFVKKSGLCFACLNRGHISASCRKKLTCSTCKINHPTIMHRENTYRTFDNGRTTNFVTGAGKRIICPVVAAQVKVCGAVHTINVALDTHSSDCWIRSSLAEQLQAKMYPTTINLTTMHNKKEILKGKFIHDLKIGDIDGNNWTEIPSLYVREDREWPFVKEDLPSEEDICSVPHLQGVPFNFLRNDEVKMLIGMNMPGLIKPLKVVNGDFMEPFATQHWLGWAFNGPSVRKSRDSISYKASSGEVEEKIEALYAQDFIDPPYRETYSVEEKAWFTKVGNSLRKLDNGSYEIALPFYDDNVSFPSNKIQAERRLSSLDKRFKSDHSYYEEYNEFMKVMIDKGFAEEVPHDQLTIREGKEWYLVHHAVYHKQKRKLRIVFDCSLCYDGVSLNSKLMQGPDLTNTLVGVLLRFRQNKHAFTSDIEKMFYQVKIPDYHANYLKFLWFNDSGEVIQYRLRVHVFGAKSSPSVANYALRQSAEEHSVKTNVKNSIYKNFYVDDLLKSTETLHEAILMAKDIKNTIGKAHFNLTSFRSNSLELLRNVTPHRNYQIRDEYVKIEKTLGLRWDTERDILMYDCVEIKPVTTRRDILRTVASLYDPLGLVSPAVLPAKRLFQETCRLKLQWDETLPDDILSSWNRWTTSIKEIELYKIHRCFKNIFTTPRTIIEMHLFCDGSEIAYGAMAYIRFISGTCVEVSSPVFVKSRLTPVNSKTLKTIPRIELSSAKLAVEISEVLQFELEYEFTEVVFWTDSTIVLAYLQNESKRFHRFVDNKVSFIRGRSFPQQWHHVASENNPADFVSRGATLVELSSSDLWKTGPAFLKELNKSEGEIYDTLDGDVEVKNEKKSFMINTMKSATCRLIESSSSFYKIKNRIAWMLKFIDYLNKKNVSPKITVENLSMAENRIYIYTQKLWFTDTYLRDVRKLMPFVSSDGVWRVGGRLKNSDLQHHTKHPIILPGQSLLVKFLIKQAHAAVGHLGRESTSSFLRKRYWITKGSSTIKSVIKECLICRKYQSKPSPQVMADLPKTRTMENSVFKHVGLDYFGPFHTIHGRKSEKRYGVIFTCLSTRAAHLEISHTLNSDSFISALRRFVSRRGEVSSITSDNGTNFVGANRELRDAVKTWNSEVTRTWLKKRNIEWKFNPPTASHYGGVWEREIRTIRKILNGIMKEQPNKLTDECLLTLMCEVESILNNRPITPVSNDPNDLEALTPNHALLINTGMNLPPTISYCNNYKKHWKRVQYLASIFWYRWRREYLSILQQRQKWYKSEREFKIGDLVLVTDLNLPRNQWPLGRVIELKTSEDGRRRTAVVKVAKKQDSKLAHMERPITKLIYLCNFG